MCLNSFFSFLLKLKLDIMGKSDLFVECCVAFFFEDDAKVLSLFLNGLLLMLLNIEINTFDI